MDPSNLPHCKGLVHKVSLILFSSSRVFLLSLILPPSTHNTRAVTHCSFFPSLRFPTLPFHNSEQVGWKDIMFFRGRLTVQLLIRFPPGVLVSQLHCFVLRSPALYPRQAARNTLKITCISLKTGESSSTVHVISRQHGEWDPHWPWANQYWVEILY